MIDSIATIQEKHLEKVEKKQVIQSETGVVPRDSFRSFDRSMLSIFAILLPGFPVYRSQHTMQKYRAN